MELVTMGEAAHYMGISVDTVRRRLRRGELLGHYQPTPQGIIWWVEIPERLGPAFAPESGSGSRLSVRADTFTGPAFALAGTSAGVAVTASGIGALRGLMKVLKHETDTKDRLLEAQDRQIKRLNALLQQTIYAPLPPGRNRASNSGPER